MSSSPYSLGFTTLDAEATCEELPVRGAVPAWLSGTLIRTGPAKFEVGEQAFNHWFDGLAMLHRFGIAAGRVSYRNRYLHSQAFDESAATGKISRREFATDPCRSIFRRVASLFFPEPFTDNGAVNVIPWHDIVVALTETRLPVQFDPATLRTVGVREYDRSVKGAVATAHPHFDRTRGRHFNYLVDFGYRSKYQVLAIDEKTGQETVFATIPVDRPAYMHSFGMTERYLILTEFPLVVSPLKLLLSGKPFIRNYQWQPQRGVRFYVIEKDSGRLVRTARTDAFFAFHHVNAFEEGDDVVVDVITQPDATIIDQLYLERLRASVPVDPTGTLMRYRVSSNSTATNSAVTSVQLSGTRLELPRFNYGRCAGRPYRFVYGASQVMPGQFFDSLVKLDLERWDDHQEVKSWRQEGCYPGEPIFVAAPGAAQEDEGVILSVVLDANRAASFLLVLDAATFTELARAEVPHHIPFSFHGNYLAAR
jgi:carotenoid cleavage dioxygenase-like enzyme